jgi:hypothetical protein
VPAGISGDATSYAVPSDMIVGFRGCLMRRRSGSNLQKLRYHHLHLHLLLFYKSYTVLILDYLKHRRIHQRMHVTVMHSKDQVLQIVIAL